MAIPVFSDGIYSMCISKIQQSFALCRESELLLETAKRTIETWVAGLNLGEHNSITNSPIRLLLYHTLQLHTDDFRHIRLKAWDFQFCQFP